VGQANAVKVCQAAQQLGKHIRHLVLADTLLADGKIEVVLVKRHFQEKCERRRRWG
jgi:aspartate ammonia-lyase